MSNSIDRRDIQKAQAARAIFPQVRGMLPKIQMTLVDYDGQVLELNLDHEIAADLIKQITAAYRASLPRI